MAGPAIIVAMGEADLGQRAADLVCSQLEQAAADRGAAHLVLTGGSTARTLYPVLARPPVRDRVPWAQLHLWWGDDRYVPVDDPDSNVRTVQETLLASLRDVGGGPPLVPTSHVHPFPVSASLAAHSGPNWCALRYAEEIRARVPSDDTGVPIFDLVLLGVGPDGHCLSCFPHGAPLRAPVSTICMAVPAPDFVAPHVPRVTLSPRVTERARGLLVMVSGASKAPVLRAILTGPPDMDTYPAQIAAREGATWLLDAGAASQLPSHLIRAGS